MLTTHKPNKSVIITLLLTILVATLGRLVPHPPDCTPLATIAILSGALLDKRIGLLLVCLSLMLSDAILSVVHGYPLFGSWTIFAYSGFMAMTLFTPAMQNGPRWFSLVGYSVIMTFLYWCWTNFGTWWLSGLYSFDTHGLVACYFMAIPFLGNALLGNFIYMTLFIYVLQPVKRRVFN